ncbi:alpha/beta hydrolase [Croceitalea sp. MTPC9]|uniref:alpha/beta hydrolase n=1 Tax=unclassified Croceitalea TaxID=2632280 RepID=UPI002B3D0AF7|nr:alpha/beta hydrolase [Croceitalea sp. MTPC6]GMN15162.1 alpha/beta hydrolase [Croceitalea sp. MTPC9]
MKNPLILFAFMICFTIGFSQEIIELPNKVAEGISWKGPEKEYYSEIWQTQVVTNVSKPTMEVFRPSKDMNTGTAVIVAPGGGLYAHSINSEGNDVGKWLAEKGITAFVLKYRLVPTDKDGVAEITELSTTNPQKIIDEVAKVLPLSIEDGLNAISHVRKNATKYGINPSKIGFMGFSAGGAVTMGIGYNYSKENRPDFMVPIYAWTDVITVKEPKNDVPPTLLICATDDPLGLAKGSVELYQSLQGAGKSVALHMYAKGGHGFGMREQGLPSDKWIERFYEWSVAQGITEPKH